MLVATTVHHQAHRRAVRLARLAQPSRHHAQAAQVQVQARSVAVAHREVVAVAVVVTVDSTHG